jgi:hypothetical protein
VDCYDGTGLVELVVLVKAAVDSVAARSTLQDTQPPSVSECDTFDVIVTGSAAARPAIAWPMMRKLGAGLWLLDPEALRLKVAGVVAQADLDIVPAMHQHVKIHLNCPEALRLKVARFG